MLLAMRGARARSEIVRRRFRLGAALLIAGVGQVKVAAAQELPRVSAGTAVVVEGVVSDAGFEDVLGLSRLRFQGLIASELGSVGYHVEPLTGVGAATPGALVLLGTVKEERCDDLAPRQCRLAIQWQLQRRNGLVVYRSTTRAVEQQPTLDAMRRELVRAALHGLLVRRRFAMRLRGPDVLPSEPERGIVGFRRCQRAELALPGAAKVAAASLTVVESGSSLEGGVILSADGLILTAARAIDASAPLRVRFAGGQVLPARVVARADAADVALLYTAARTDRTCLPLREEPPVAGQGVFGVSSVVSAEPAWSLTRSVLQSIERKGGQSLLLVDARIARAAGSPLLDEQGRLLGVVTETGEPSASARSALTLEDALAALRVKPAQISDPRLIDSADQEDDKDLGYVRDPDDPPFVLTRSYSYGTSAAAHRLRTASVVTATVGALGVGYTWLNARSNRNVSPSEHSRQVLYNDISWILLGLGAVGVGASFAWPEGHDTVAARSARRELTLGVAGSSVQLGGSL